MVGGEGRKDMYQVDKGRNLFLFYMFLVTRNAYFLGKIWKVWESIKKEIKDKNEYFIIPPY